MALRGKELFRTCDALTRVTDDGRVYVWGYNGDYQLALGDESDRTVPVLHPDLREVVQISAGADFTLGLTST